MINADTFFLLECLFLFMSISFHMQFIIFYACALDPEDCGVKFTNTLFEALVNGDNHLTRLVFVSGVVNS